MPISEVVFCIPSGAFLEGQAQTILDKCKTGGNTHGFVEGFGNGSGHADVLGKWSAVQGQYWEMLHDLHIGATFCAMYNNEPSKVFVSNYDLGGDPGPEWVKTLDFVDKYAGYQQFPAASPGAWLALREGHRLVGNYDFLMTQIVNGTTAHRGTDLYAGSTGNFFNFPSSDDVGKPSQTIVVGSTDNTNDVGVGQRQSIWAMDFAAGETLKVVLDTTFANSIIGKTVTVRTTYLDNSPTAVLTISAFNDELGGVGVANSGDWKELDFTVGPVVLATDGDGAHLSVAVSGGSCRLHMIEVFKN